MLLRIITGPVSGLPIDINTSHSEGSERHEDMQLMHKAWNHFGMRDASMGA